MSRLFKRPCHPDQKGSVVISTPYFINKSGSSSSQSSWPLPGLWYLLRAENCQVRLLLDPSKRVTGRAAFVVTSSRISLTPCSLLRHTSCATTLPALRWDLHLIFALPTLMVLLTNYPRHDASQFEETKAGWWCFFAPKESGSQTSSQARIPISYDRKIQKIWRSNLSEAFSQPPSYKQRGRKILSFLKYSCTRLM